ncbi:MAG: co-chaperone DjlA [Gammaproteobacteria bacterium]|nr:co-chaperone DjlA [Gammaproteobacteria bacterium]MDH4314988.1 co-chaperone DjlA [Gammaproteobacteria bacterium]
MPYWGKIIGTLIGLATGRPLLALLGLILGHQFDRGFAGRIPGPGQHERLSAEFIAALFQTMGHLAKADGRVSEDEIRAARSIMHRLNLGASDTRQAIAWFEEGKSGSFPLQETLQRLRNRGANRPELRGLFVRLLMEVSLAKSMLHQRERAVIWTICQQLEIGRVELAQLEAMLRAQKSFKRSPQGNADAVQVDNAYRTLGIDKSSTNDEIKKAYRRLMNKNHPDKISADNPAPAVVAEAERKTRDIRGAYEMLKARRSIR